MTSMNKVFLAGNLTADPELRQTNGGTAVGTLRLAVNEKYKTKSGEEKEDVCFVDVVVWGRQAEMCGDRLGKGATVLVEGRLELSQWDTKDGEKRSKVRVRASRVQFMDSRRSNGETDGE